MTPAAAEGPRRRHRKAWITAALLSAVLVVAPATWQVWSWGSTRSGTLSGTLSGGGDGRPVTALEIVGGDADITVTPAGTTRSATGPRSAGPSRRPRSRRAGSATPCG